MGVLRAGPGGDGPHRLRGRCARAAGLGQRPARLTPGRGDKLSLWLTNYRSILPIHHSRDGKRWEKYGVQMEISGYHHNTAGRFLSLLPGVYAAGEGRVRFLDFRYRALD